MKFFQRSARLGVLTAACFFLFLAVVVAPSADSFDILIRDGRIVDGAGNPWFRGDVGIRGDSIAAVGHLPGAKAERVIDAGGHIVAPGFIDMHNHGRRGIFKVPTAENYIRQGVTTIIEGNDGGSCIRQPLNQLRDAGPRPRPLTDPRQGFIVDVDDLDRHAWVVDARFDALVGVEDQPTGLLYGPDVADPEPKHKGQDEERDETLTEAFHGPHGSGTEARSKTTNRPSASF